MSTLAAVFPRALDADLAVQDLEREGVDGAHISVLLADDAEVPPPSPHVDAGAAAAVGFTSGAVGGALAALGLAALPGVGWLFGAGPVAAVVASSATTATTASVLASLGVALGEEADGTPRATSLAEAVHRGGTLVCVRNDPQHDERVLAVLRRHRPIALERSARRWQESGWQGYDPEQPRPTAAERELERAAFDRERVGPTEHWDLLHFG